MGAGTCRLGEELHLQVVVLGERAGVLRLALPRSPQWQEVGGGQVVLEVEEGVWRRVVRVVVRVLRLGKITVVAEARLRSAVFHGALEVEVTERGFPSTLHSSLQLGLDHNSYSVQTFSVADLGENTVILSISGDHLGPPLPTSIHPSSTCEEAAARLASLLHHHTYRSRSQGRLEDHWPADMNTAYQELVSCQHPSGGFSFHFGSLVLSVWVTAVAVETLALAARKEVEGLVVDEGLVVAGVEWLMGRQGSEGEWGEGDMFPDLDQAPVELQPTSVTAQVVVTLASLSEEQMVNIP